MNDCVICQLVNKAIPSWVIHEDEEVICFLPLEIEAFGHTIVAPKTHCPDLFSLSPETLSCVLVALQKVALHYRAAIGCTGVNLLHASGSAAQQSVPHFHVHLIPRFDEDGLDAWPHFPKAQCDKDELRDKLRF